MIEFDTFNMTDRCRTKTRKKRRPRSNPDQILIDIGEEKEEEEEQEEEPCPAPQSKKQKHSHHDRNCACNTQGPVWLDRLLEPPKPRLKKAPAWARAALNESDSSDDDDSCDVKVAPAYLASGRAKWKDPVNPFEGLTEIEMPYYDALEYCDPDILGLPGDPPPLPTPEGKRQQPTKKRKRSVDLNVPKINISKVSKTCVQTTKCPGSAVPDGVIPNFNKKPRHKHCDKTCDCNREAPPRKNLLAPPQPCTKKKTPAYTRTKTNRSDSIDPTACDDAVTPYNLGSECDKNPSDLPIPEETCRRTKKRKRSIDFNVPAIDFEQAERYEQFPRCGGARPYQTWW